jgi:Alpha-lytic protease prodomain
MDRVARSYQQLENLTSRLARNARKLAASGVNLQSWAPDPATDTVKITLVTPAHPTREALASQASTARSTLDRKYGAAWVTIAGQTQARSTAAQRDNDSVPYYAGDGIYLGALGLDCSSGWSTTG